MHRLACAEPKPPTSAPMRLRAAAMIASLCCSASVSAPKTRPCASMNAMGPASVLPLIRSVQS
eukprot:6195589-Pleurochrysis_carterae.AAC.2